MNPQDMLHSSVYICNVFSDYFKMFGNETDPVILKPVAILTGLDQEITHFPLRGQYLP